MEEDSGSSVWALLASITLGVFGIGILPFVHLAGACLLIAALLVWATADRLPIHKG